MGSGVINTLVIQRADVALGVATSHNRQVVSTETSRAVAAASSSDGVGASESSSAKSFAQEFSSRANGKDGAHALAPSRNISGNTPANGINRAKPAVESAPAPVSDVKITETARIAASRPVSAQMHLSPTARTIFSLLDAFPQGVGPLTSPSPLFVAAAHQAKTSEKPAGKDASSPFDGGQRRKDSASQLPKSSLSSHPEPLAASFEAMIERAAMASARSVAISNDRPGDSPASDPSVKDDSDPNELTPDLEKKNDTSQKNGANQSAGTSLPGTKSGNGEHHALDRSALTDAADRLEKLWSQAANEDPNIPKQAVTRASQPSSMPASKPSVFDSQASPPADSSQANAKPGSASAPPELVAQVSKAGPSSGLLIGALREVLKKTITESGLFYESHLRRLVLDPEHMIETLRHEPQGRLSVRDNPLSPPVHEHDFSHSPAIAAKAADLEQARAIVRQQLEIVSTQTVQWKGEVWPQAHIQWEIREYSREKDGENAAAYDHKDVQKAWTTSLLLDLPHLGSIEVKLTIHGNRVSARFASAQSESKLREKENDFRAHMEQIGMSASSVTFSSPVHQPSTRGGGLKFRSRT